MVARDFRPAPHVPCDTSTERRQHRSSAASRLTRSGDHAGPLLSPLLECSRSPSGTFVSDRARHICRTGTKRRWQRGLGRCILRGNTGGNRDRDSVRRNGSRVGTRRRLRRVPNRRADVAARAPPSSHDWSNARTTERGRFADSRRKGDTLTGRRRWFSPSERCRTPGAVTIPEKSRPGPGTCGRSAAYPPSVTRFSNEVRGIHEGQTIRHAIRVFPGRCSRARGLLAHSRAGIFRPDANADVAIAGKDRTNGNASSGMYSRIDGRFPS